MLGEPTNAVHAKFPACIGQEVDGESWTGGQLAAELNHADRRTEINLRGV